MSVVLVCPLFPIPALELGLLEERCSNGCEAEDRVTLLTRVADASFIESPLRDDPVEADLAGVSAADREGFGADPALGGVVFSDDEPVGGELSTSILAGGDDRVRCPSSRLTASRTASTMMKPPVRPTPAEQWSNTGPGSG